MAAPGAVVRVKVPARIRALSGLDRIDYADAHAVRGAAADEVTPVQWAREMLERAPAVLRSQLPPGWFLLGLRHGSPRSAEHVLGWPIRSSTNEHVVLAADSRLGMPAELVLVRDGPDWVFATLIEHDNRTMATLWRALGRSHRQLVRHLLRGAARRRIGTGDASDAAAPG